MNGAQQFKNQLIYNILSALLPQSNCLRPMLRTTPKQSKASDNNHNPFIRIDTPNSNPRDPQQEDQLVPNVHQFLEGQIRDVRQIVFKGNRALQDSRRQEQSKQKLVQSDRMQLSFNHQYANKNRTIQRIKLQGVFQQGLQSSRQQSEGGIQIPLQLQKTSHQERYLNNQKDFTSSFNTSRQLKANRLIERKQKQLELQITKRSIEKTQREKVHPDNETKRHQQNVMKHVNARKYREIFGRSKETIKLKDCLNRSMQSKGSLKYKTQMHFLNQSSERLPIYLPFERSLSKQRKHKLKTIATTQKARIKLNKPNLKQAPRYNQPNQTPKNKRPRHHIEFQLKKQSKNVDYEKEDRGYREWKQLKEKVEKYDFVRKYVSQSDLFLMFQCLKKNGVDCEKWVLFVVEEAYRRMGGTQI